MPGHVFPLRARPGGVLERAGHTEAAVDLARLAGLAPAGVICEIMNDDGTMARRPQLEAFAAEHGLKMITVADLIRYRRRTERLVVQESEGPAAHALRRVRRLRLPQPASTTARTWRWSSATSRARRTCWCACTRSA